VYRNRTYGTVIPDFMLTEADDGRLIIDAKYKLRERLDPADIYQCFLYAQAFGNMQAKPPHAMLIVPSISGTVEHWPLEVRTTQGAAKSVLDRVAVPVAAAADEMQGGKHGAVAAMVAKLVSDTID